MIKSRLHHNSYLLQISLINSDAHNCTGIIRVMCQGYPDITIFVQRDNKLYMCMTLIISAELEVMSSNHARTIVVIYSKFHRHTTAYMEMYVFCYNYMCGKRLLTVLCITLIISAHFSATITVGATGCPEGMMGRIEVSATRRPETPFTLKKINEFCNFIAQLYYRNNKHKYKKINIPCKVDINIKASHSHYQD